MRKRSIRTEIRVARSGLELNTPHPLFEDEIGEVQIKNGNSVFCCIGYSCVLANRHVDTDSAWKAYGLFTILR